MCTSIIEIARAEGMAKRGDQWSRYRSRWSPMITRAMRRSATSSRSTSYNTELDPGARAGIELTLETAKELRAALDRAIAAAEFEEAEVRGKGALLSLVRAA